MPFSIPQSNPKANTLAHGRAIEGAISRVLESGWDILGQEVASFEKKFAGYPGISQAIVPVHLYGHPADMSAILEIANRHNLRVVEDCAQSHGATFRGKKTGTLGHLAAFSFYSTKDLGALGDAGMVVPGDPELAGKVRLLREYGWEERYVSKFPGMNSRLDEVQAGILRVKLPHLDEENESRRKIAGTYHSLLAACGLILPGANPEAAHVYHQYVIRAKNRDSLRAHLRERGIGTLIHYPVPVHQQPAYAERWSGRIPLPRTEEAAKQILSLPMYPELTTDQVRTVAREIVAWCRS